MTEYKLPTNIRYLNKSGNGWLDEIDGITEHESLFADYCESLELLTDEDLYELLLTVIFREATEPLGDYKSRPTIPAGYVRHAVTQVLAARSVEDALNSTAPRGWLNQKVAG